MKHLVEKDKRLREEYSKGEWRYIALKGILMSQKLELSEKVYGLKKIGVKMSKVRIRNRCVVTGRGRAIYRGVKLSRIKLREYVSKGLISGVKKSSW